MQRDPIGDMMGKRSNFERREADFYPTPRAAVRAADSAPSRHPHALPSRAAATARWSGIWNPSACAASMPATSAAARMRLRSTITARPMRSSRTRPTPAS